MKLTIDKVKFEAVLTQLSIVQDAATLLGDDVDAADSENTFGVLSIVSLVILQVLKNGLTVILQVLKNGLTVR
jgi:hypothetical protein